MYVQVCSYGGCYNWYRVVAIQSVTRSQLSYSTNLLTLSFCFQIPVKFTDEVYCDKARDVAACWLVTDHFVFLENKIKKNSSFCKLYKGFVKFRSLTKL